MTDITDTATLPHTIKEYRVDVEAWRAALGRVTFKFPIPVKMWIQDDRPWGYGALLRMSMPVPDRDTGKETTVHSAHVLSWSPATTGEMLRCIYTWAKDLILHEFDEHFRVDDQILFDPHATDGVFYDANRFEKFNEQRNH